MSHSSRTRPPRDHARDGEGEAHVPDSLVPWEAPPSQKKEALPAQAGPWEAEDALEDDGGREDGALEEGPASEWSRLVMEARLAEGEERRTLAQTLGERLEALGHGGGSREKADVLLELLDARRLGLWMKDGRSCRQVAVETLLGMGYPYALEVRPEDLAYLRERTLPEENLAGVATGAGAAGLVGLGMLLQWLEASSELPPQVSGPPVDAPLMLTWGLSVLALLAGMLGPPRSLTRQAGLAVLGVLTALQLWMGLQDGSHGLVSGTGALLAWLLLVLARR